jgi:hypothetical protein
MEGVNTLNDFARSGRGAGAFGVISEMPLMEIDANYRRVLQRREFVKACRQLAPAAIDVDVHTNIPRSRSPMYEAGGRLFAMVLLILIM